MRKKWSLGLMSAALLASSLMVTPAFCADNNIKVEYANSSTQAQSNTIACKIKLTNTSRQEIALEDYTLRYYYTKDQDLKQCMWCDNASMIAGGNYTTLTQKITGTFVNMDVPTDNADTYLELGFAKGTGTLAPGGVVEIQLRLTNDSWRNYNQANDFSFDAVENIPLYEGGVLVLGQEPVAEGVVDSQVVKTDLSYDKNVAINNEVSTAIVLNDNTLDAVKLNGKALAAEDYTLDADGKFTFSESYLKGLEVGTYKYVFDFSQGKDVVVTLDVTDTTDYDFAITLPQVDVAEGDEVEIPVAIQNIKEGINNMDFTLSLDTANFEFVEAAPAGTLDTEGEKASLMTSYHETTGVLNVVYVDAEQNGENLMNEDGTFMVVKVKAKKDFTGAPLKLKKLGAVRNQDLKKLSLSVKVK